MPDTFQCSDSKRIVGPTPKKSDYGLPEDKFILCSFNNNYKITPEIFTAWMEILKGTPNSILWLLEDNPWAKRSMIEEAEKLSVDPARLYFAGRVSPENYLARYKLADLFLDCYPFNGGTTVNDALWVGLPVITLSGRSFASRMAGSLLNEIGMKSFVCHSISEYKYFAIEFYSDSNINKNFSNSQKSIFNNKKFTLNLQTIFEKL
jgi:predicted O-linked N-acetylglucosamine transferase (SPINDLY family)